MNNKKIISRAAALELSLLENGVALVIIDCRDSKVNLLSSAVLGELEQVLTYLETPGFCKGVVFVSGKENCFVAGADIKEILRAQESDVSEEQVFEACQRGKSVLQRISALPLPTVAAIHGRCLGGGTELALSCSIRIASNDRSTVIGLPEVGLGVLPGWGGTVKTAKNFGLLAALSLILNPLRPWSAKKALSKGLVSAVVNPSSLLDAALYAAFQESGSRSESNGSGPSSKGSGAEPKGTGPGAKSLGAPASSLLLTLGRKLVIAVAGCFIKATVGRKYPAPPAVLKVLAAAFELPESEALELESRTFARLCKTDASRRCVQKFLEYQQAKKAKSAAH